jgi:signal transduction histidine kinase
VRRLNDLTTQFLNFAREAPLCLAEIDLAELCAELCAHLRRQHPNQQSLRIHNQATQSVRILADRDRLRQVLLNLTQNAVQAMDEQGDVRIAAMPLPDGGAELQVADSGPGISDEQLRVLFTPFRTTKPTGTGLGLVVCRRIVEQHGGSISVATAAAENPASGVPQVGTCFLIRLPGKPPRQSTAQTPASGSA